MSPTWEIRGQIRWFSLVLPSGPRSHLRVCLSSLVMSTALPADGDGPQESLLLFGQTHSFISGLLSGLSLEVRSSLTCCFVLRAWRPFRDSLCVCVCIGGGRASQPFLSGPRDS